MPTQLQQYLVLDGIELINSNRTRAYVDAGFVPWYDRGWCFNDNLVAGIPDVGYADPVTDPAPWFDTNDSDSEHFFGIAVRSLTSEMPLARFNSSDRRIGRLSTKVRTFTLEADLLADNACGTDYGKRWLLAVFRAGCGAGCATLPATLSVCEDAFRDVYGVGLVEFEDITPPELCPGARVKVTFNAENPYLYGPPIGVLINGLWEGSSFSDDDCVPWDDCPEPTETACASPVQPTIAPPPLPSLAGPLAPGGVNVPWCNPTFEVTQCAALPVLPSFGEAVYRFTIDNSSGTDDAFNMRIRIFEPEDPTDCVSPPGFGDATPVIAELRISFIPAGGVLVVDGATKTIQLYCPDVLGWINADHLIYGPNSAFWQHPVIGCGAQSLCACCTADAENIDPACTFSVEIVPRYL